MKQIDAIPVACNDREECERRRARAAENAELLTLQVRQRFDRRIFSDKDHVDRREHTVDHDEVFPFASRRGHGRETGKADVHFTLRNHEVKIGRAERLDFIRLQSNLVEQTVPFHDEIDEFLGAWNEA